MKSSNRKVSHKTLYLDNNKVVAGTFDAARENKRAEMERFLAGLDPDQVINICECRNDRAWDCTVWYWENIDEQG